MRSMFQMGFAGRGSFPAHSQVRLATLGQNTTIDGNAYIAQINDAMNKMQSVQAWVDSHPNYMAQLGSDGSRFQAMYTQAPTAYDTVTNVYQRISTNDPAAWTISSVEKSQVDGWIAVMNELAKIVAAHPDSGGITNAGAGFPNVQLTPVKPGAPVPAGAVPAPAAGGISPLAIGAIAAGALAVGLVVLS